MIIYKRWQWRIAEFHYDEASAALPVDIVRHFWRPAPMAGFECKPAYTLVLDLTRSLETLLGQMHRETRYRIQRSERECFQYQCWPEAAPEALDEFHRFYDEFALRKHLLKLNWRRLEALRQLGTLDLSRIRDAAGRTLIWHAHYRTHDRARGIYSASAAREGMEPSFRSLVGTANRYLTWRDMLHFREQGLGVYDLGGWYGGAEDAEKLRINSFKESFGGNVIEEYNSEAGITPAGRLALHSKAMLVNALFRTRQWLRPTQLASPVQSRQGG